MLKLKPDHPKRAAVSVLLLMLVLISSCKSSITEQQAQDNAIAFINGRVKFFVKAEANHSSSVEKTEILNITSARISDRWLIKAHVKSNLGNTTKQRDINVSVDANSGKVIEFNGAKVI